MLYEKRLSKVIHKLQEENRPGLSLFLTGGYPNPDEFIEILKFINKEKLADFLEIGIPFSDPVADGVVIQEASQVAIEQGASFNAIMSKIRKVRSQLEIPMVAMTYINPVYAGGLEKNFTIMRDAGIDAIIIPDLPVEEADAVMGASKKTGLDIVFLGSPSTPLERIRRISKSSSPFLYYVSRFGITGVRSKLSSDLSSKIKKIKKYSSVPVYCGFGISDGSQAAVVGKDADGVIIGSALTKLISKSKVSYFKEIKKFAINIQKELKNCRE
jgi:tryptophan synthase alpha chain